MRYSRINKIICGTCPQTQRIYNAGCLVAMVFCSLSAIESAIAGLSIYLVASNTIYSVTLGFLFFLSRIKNKLYLSRMLGIILLVFLYTPVLWFLNGGSTSGIPYFIVMFISFLVVLTIDEKNSRKERIFSITVIAVDILVVTSLIIAEYIYPNKIYVFPNRFTQYIDMAAGMIIAVLGNYFILKTFVIQHYKDLEEIKSYSNRLEELIQIDAMTDLLNHTHFIKKLESEIEKAIRYNRPLSLLMLDLDFFKNVNDKYGHQFGDEVLISVASSLKKCSRTVDIPARYGGEEFILALPETNTESALVVAERLRSCIQKMSLSIPVTITISGGIVQCDKNDSAHNMIKKADDLLYKAKKQGRNRICIEQNCLTESEN